MIVGSNILAGASGQQGYFLNRSVRLRASASAYFNRAVTSTSNTALWTYSEWVKLGVLSTDRIIFGAGSSSNEYTAIYFDSSNRFNYVTISGGVIQAQLISTPVYRDPSGFYHLVFTYDSAQATSTNRLKLYINGVQVTVFTTATYPSINAATYINNSVTGGNHFIGKSVFSSAAYFDGYLTEINFIDGQALTPSSFGEYNTITGVWQPKKYGGTYGTNGFYLNFNDNSAATAAAIGKDSSGNGNNWTPNNISVTAGVTYDSMTDVPTLTSATTANYAVMNPLNVSQGVYPITDGNLKINYTASAVKALASIFVTTGKWYAEFTAVQVNNTSNADAVGVSSSATGLAAFRAYNPRGEYYNGSSWAAYGATYTNGDIVGVAVDVDAQTITFYKNNVAQPTRTSIGLSELTFIGWANATAGDNYAANFGQRPFSYTPPTGFKALNTYNLPTPTIKNGAEQFAATLYTGNGAARSITNGGNNTIGTTFQPDFVWLKSRSNAFNNYLYDSVRGALKEIYTDSTSTQVTATQTMTAFNSNGFSLGTDNGINQNAATFAAWQWKASNAAAVTNTSGTISSQVSANTTAGFSVVTYTGTGANGATFGHGLGVAPAFGIWKVLSGTIGNWVIYHKSLGATKGLNFTTGGATTSAVFFNNTAPTSSVWSLGTVTDVNRSTSTYVNYAFAEIAGYSKFGSYTGNGSTDGTFVYLGFRPRLVMTKRTDAASQWYLMDTSRDLYNCTANILFPNGTTAESANTGLIDELSNGFKLRSTNTDANANGGTYIYMAFAENPFNYSLAR
jgi:hypothetical protein